MEEIKIMDVKMPEEIGVKGENKEKNSQIERVLDNILCDD